MRLRKVYVWVLMHTKVKPMNKLVKEIIILVLAALLFVAGMFTGYSYSKRSQDAGVIKQQQQDAEDVDKHRTETDKVNENVAKTITIIKKIKDPSGCLDVASPDEYLDGLLNADSKTQYNVN